MNDISITCPKCGAQVPLSEAVSHRIREELSRDFDAKRREIEEAFAARERKLNKAQSALEQQQQSIQKEIQSRVAVHKQKLLSQATQEVQEKLAVEMKDLEARLAEQKEQLHAAHFAELNLRKKQRELEEAKESLELEITRQLDAERTKIGEQAAKAAAETERLKLAEKEKIIGDLQREIQNLKQIGKLKEDQRAVRAEVAVLVSQVLPGDIRAFGAADGIWISDIHCALPLAAALRQGLVGIGTARQAETGKQTKMEQVYQYLAGTEFRQHVEAVVEAFVSMKNDLEIEKRAFAKRWTAREQQIEQAITHTAMLYGRYSGNCRPERAP